MSSLAERLNVHWVPGGDALRAASWDELAKIESSLVEYVSGPPIALVRLTGDLSSHSLLSCRLSSDVLASARDLAITFNCIFSRSQEQSAATIHLLERSSAVRVPGQAEPILFCGGLVVIGPSRHGFSDLMSEESRAIWGWASASFVVSDPVRAITIACLMNRVDMNGPSVAYARELVTRRLIEVVDSS